MHGISGSYTRGGLLGFIIGVAVYAAIGYYMPNAYYRQILLLVPFWACAAIGWNVFSGYSGLISFGHAIFFGIGSYTTILGITYFHLNPWLTILLGVGLAAVAAWVVGKVTLKLEGDYFALAMLAYPISVLYICEWLGWQEMPLPVGEQSGWANLSFENTRPLILLCCGLLVVYTVLASRIRDSKFGLNLLAIRQDEPAAMAVGIAPMPEKLKALMVSGMLVSVMGSVYVFIILVVTPTAVFGLMVSAQLLIFAIVGGIGTVYGPVIGAVLLVPLAELLQGSLGSRLPGIQGIAYGAVLILVMIWLPQGIGVAFKEYVASRRRSAHGMRPRVPAVGTIPDHAHRAANVEAAKRETESRAPGSMILEVHDLTVTFGALAALQHVNLSVRSGEVLGILGPNGAGKTTLFNAIGGFVPLNDGQVILHGDDITACRPYERARRELGRTFQVPRPFARMSVLENVVVAGLERSKDLQDARRRARDALALTGLDEVADELAKHLPMVDIRLLEIARAIASGSTCVLLDETLAGLGSDEIQRVLSVIRRLADTTGRALIIIEHTIGALVQVCDHFLVLNNGMVIAEGDPGVVMRHPDVVSAYLGADDE